MQQTPFSYVFEAGRGFRRPASSRNPAVRAATLAGATVLFLVFLLLLIPLLLLFVAFFVVFWVIARVRGLFAPREKSSRENVRVMTRGDHSTGV